MHEEPEFIQSTATFSIDIIFDGSALRVGVQYCQAIGNNVTLCSFCAYTVTQRCIIHANEAELQRVEKNTLSQWSFFFR